MAANHKREARRLSSSCDHPLVPCNAQGRHALGNEYIATRLALALQTAQGPEFAPAPERCRRRQAAALITCLPPISDFGFMNF